MGELLNPLGRDGLRWASLRLLSVRRCDLRLLDASVGLLDSAQQVNVSHNRIAALDPAIRCGSLQSLVLSHNKLGDLRPFETMHLPRLRKLNLSHNKIRSLAPLTALAALQVRMTGC